MASMAFTFPGQGSQAVGMGKDMAAAYPEARAVFQEVDEALGQRLSANPPVRIMTTRPKRRSSVIILTGGFAKAAARRCRSM